MLVLEELLIIVLQFVGELFVELAFWFPWDFLVLLGESKPGPDKRPSMAGLLIAGFVLGAIMGGISLLIQPAAMLKQEVARLLNLLITPALCGLSSLGLARLRLRRGRRTDPRAHFWFAIVFSAAFLVVRFTWAERTPNTPQVRATVTAPFVRSLK